MIKAHIIFSFNLISIQATNDLHITAKDWWATLSDDQHVKYPGRNELEPPLPDKAV